VKPEIVTLPSEDYPFYPLGPFKSESLAGGITESSQYDTPERRQWSELVKSFHGLLIVTPEYNWGYPGELKNSIDQLFNEWKAKPVALITYGAFGGATSREQLKIVVESGVKMNLVAEAGINLPGEYIGADKRVGKTEGGDKWLDEFEGAVLEAVTKVLEASKSNAKL
jgi:NAD(P)H-dependent FMN reductase